MGAKVYSAGTIFLQVVPVFKDVMDDIRRNARDWDAALGDQMEKSGREAGKRANKAIGEELTKGNREAGKKAGDDYAGAFSETFRNGVRKANRELEPIEVKVESNGVRRELAQIRREFKELGDQEIGVDIDAKEAYAELLILEARLRGVQADAKSIRVKVDVDEATKGVEAFRKRVEKALPDIDIPVHVETKAAEREIGAFEKKIRDSARRASRELGDSISPELRKIARELDALGNANIGIDVNSEEALAKLREVYVQLKQVSSDNVDIGVEVDSLAAMAQLEVVDRLAGKLDGKQVSIDVDIDGAETAAAKVGGLSALLRLFSGNADGASASGQEVANSFRAFNGVVLASVTLLPALVPALAAVGGGLLALLPILAAVAGGLGAVVIGFSGIGDAVSALGAVQDNAAKDSLAAAKTMNSAAESVADAQLALARAEQQAAWARADAARQVARAKEAAAEAIEQALEQQKQAQEDYRDSVKDVRDAEEDLRQARKDAAQELMDLDNQVAQNKLDIEQGVIDVFNAQAEFNAVMADGSATNQDRDQARINLEQAELRLKELRQEQERLAAEKAKADKKGVEGTDTVKNAQDALTQALKDQKDAQKALQDASEAVTKARIEGARQIADAERNAARVAISSAQSVADAKRNLTRAEEDYAVALEKTGELGSASQQKLDLAMSKLGPAGQRFARFIFSLRERFYKFRNDIQEAFLPSVQRALEGFLDAYGPRLSHFFVRMARVAGKLFEELSKAFRGPTFRQFFAMMDRFGPKLLRQFGKTAINWLKVFARFMIISGPAALALSKAMLRISKAVLEWVNSKKGTETIQRFLGYARKVGPEVAQFFWDLVLAIVNIMEALAPFGEMVLKVLDVILKWIASLDPKTLGIIVTAILGLVIAFQLANLAVFVAYGAFSALLTPVGLVVFLIAAIITAFVILYIRFKSFRKVVDTVAAAWWAFAKIMFNFYKVILTAMAAAIVWLITKIFIPYWQAVWPVIQTVLVGIYNLWQTVLWPTFKAIGKVILWLVKNIAIPYFKLLWAAVKLYFKAIKVLWVNILWPVLDLIGTVIYKLWDKFWRPTVNKIRDKWNDFMTGAKFIWDTVLHPVLKSIMDTVLPKFQAAWETVIGAIGKAWELLKKYVAEPIFTIVDLILNQGIIDGFNTIAKFVGSTPMDHVNLPFTKEGNAVKKATGGVLPGYTPGRDTHKFYSATAGRLELSGGEAIMRPEFTRAAGKGWVDQMNYLSRTRGVRGVQEALNHQFGAFARGGVLKNPDAPVTVNGNKIAAVFAAQMAIAAKLGGPNWYLMQGGYGGNHIAASGTSHNYPGVGDLGRTGLSFYDQEWARKVGLWGWARNIPGAASVGSGAHVHALSAFSPGTAVSPQRASYLGGGDGLGGSDYGPRPKMLSNIGELLASFDLSNLPKGGGAQGIKKVVHNYPDYLAKIVKDPIHWAKGLIEGPVKEFKSKFDSPIGHMIAELPGKMVKKIAHKALDMIPGVSKFNAAGHLISSGAHAAGDAAADAVGLRNGGIIPYNGVMKYDSGGYLPPGLTSVVNLTGRPEPVLTREQMEGRGREGDTFHYEPHFEGSDLTAADVVRDMDHARRKMRREGRYARNHS